MWDFAVCYKMPSFETLADIFNQLSVKFRQTFQDL